jgi:hypothetical protein
MTPLETSAFVDEEMAKTFALGDVKVDGKLVK